MLPWGSRDSLMPQRLSSRQSYSDAGPKNTGLMLFAGVPLSIRSAIRADCRLTSW